jgi:arylsulfatase A-like enzyme/thioredoxin-like negative regulator of GroEL
MAVYGERSSVAVREISTGKVRPARRGGALVGGKGPAGRLARALAVALIACLGYIGRARPLAAANGSKPNVIFITIDTVRADHLHCYGDNQIQTPNIDALAATAARFTQAYSAVPITLPSHTTIFTGEYPMATGMHDFSDNKLPKSAVTLAEVLHKNGYSTAAFIGSAVLDSRFGLNQGFDTYFDHFDFSRLNETNLDLMDRRGDEVTDEALRWLRLNPPQPIFLWVHLYDPHYPYTPPEPYATRYRTHPYDGEIAFADSQVGRLFAFLRDNGLYDHSVIALMSDHGEGLGEHGEKTHGFFVYNSTLHVPLIIRVPGVEPRVISDEVSLADVMPTVLQALKISIPPTVQGRSLLADILGRPSSGSSQLYAETYLPLLHFHWSQLRSYQSRGMKYIDAPRAELYDTHRDPRELKNLYATRRAMAHSLHDELFSVMRRYTPSSGAATAGKELTDPALLERLRSLGYVAVSAGTFSDRSGKPLADPKDRIRVYELFSEGMSDGQHGRYDESLRKLKEAGELDPSLLPVHYLMALDYYRKRDFAQAIAEFQEVLKLDPKYALATYYLGLTYGKISDFDAAIRTLERALELDPTNFSAAYDLGAAYLKKNRVNDAVSAFERSVEVYPDYAQGHEALGEMYLYLKRTDDAVRELERAVELAPGMRKAHFELGRAYDAKGLHQEAERQFQLAKSP